MDFAFWRLSSRRERAQAVRQKFKPEALHLSGRQGAGGKMTHQFAEKPILEFFSLANPGTPVIGKRKSITCVLDFRASHPCPA
ncbi:MAG: hypothetical protein AB1717_08150 [Pseudomonadota bacterium]